MKRYQSCKLDKPLASFPKMGMGTSAVCKACSTAKSKRWYYRNREAALAAQKKRKQKQAEGEHEHEQR